MLGNSLVIEEGWPLGRLGNRGGLAPKIDST